MASERLEAQAYLRECVAGSRLLHGIRVFEFGRPALENSLRLQLSAGTMAATQGLGSSAYAHDGYVPRLPWRADGGRARMPPCRRLPPRGERKCRGRHDPKRDPDRVRSPPPRELAGPEASGPLRRSSDCSSAVSQVVEFVSSLTQAGVDACKVAGVRAQRCDCATSTRGGNDKLVGIHVDSWFDSSLEGRENGPSRLTLNLGLGDRYFLFINLTLRRIAEVLGVAGSEERKRLDLGRALGVAFMRIFPLYPVVRLRVAPGEAYLAPTESILHDGSTFGSAHLDLSLTLHGPFCSDEVIAKFADVDRPSNCAACQQHGS